MCNNYNAVLNSVCRKWKFRQLHLKIIYTGSIYNNCTGPGQSYYPKTSPYVLPWLLQALTRLFLWDGIKNKETLNILWSRMGPSHHALWMPNHFVLVVHNRQFDPSEISTLITTTRKCKARTCLFNNEENELKVTKTKKSFILEMANTTQIELNVTLKNTEFETSADQKRWYHLHTNGHYRSK